MNKPGTVVGQYILMEEASGVLSLEHCLLMAKVNLLEPL